MKTVFGLLLLFSAFRFWFIGFDALSSGDWPYLYPENAADIFWIPQIKNLWLGPYYQWTAKIFVEYLKLPWELAERVFWFWPFLVFSILSSKYLFNYLFPKSKFWMLSSLIYSLNTYILMVAGGGQMGVALSYSMSPLVLTIFIKFIDKNTSKNLKLLFITGGVYGAQMSFDPRIAYITLFAAAFYFLLRHLSLKHLEGGRMDSFQVEEFSMNFLLPLIIAVIINLYWVIPVVFQHRIPQEFRGAIYTSSESVKFFSFATLENAISLLHPNWPENMFGKVGFMKPEFLILPIIAYSSIFFIKNSNNKRVIFFILLGLVGAFLAKGANPPFGEIYLWLFEYFPGFMMFRDPTKFYILIALSYSVLIPFSVYQIYHLMKSKIKVQKSKLQLKIQKYLPGSFLLITICYLLFLIQPALFGQLGGTFKPEPVPQEYIILKNFLNDQKEPFKTLWLPQRQRFGFSAGNHPALSAGDVFNESRPGTLLLKLEEPSFQAMIRENNIKYIIVPYDLKKEIFINDYKYDEKTRFLYIDVLRKTFWLRELGGFGRINIFEL